MIQVKEVHLNGCNELELPVYELVSGKHYSNATVFELKHVYNYNNNQSFGDEVPPCWKQFVDMLANRQAVVFRDKKDLVAYSISKDALMESVAGEGKICESLDKLIKSLPEISHTWQTYAERQKALKDGEHGMDLTF